MCVNNCAIKVVEKSFFFDWPHSNLPLAWLCGEKYEKSFFKPGFFRQLSTAGKILPADNILKKHFKISD